MISEPLLNSRILELKSMMVPQSMDYTVPHHSRIEILYWLRNERNMRTEEEINQKIERIKEELLAYQKDDVMYKARVAEIEELEYCKDYGNEN